MIPFIGPSYKLRDVQAAAQRTCNMYLQRVGTPEKAQFILRAFPGFSATPFAEVGDTPGGGGSFDGDVIALLPFDADVLDYGPYRTVYAVNSGAQINTAHSKFAATSFDVTSDLNARISGAGSHLSPGNAEFTIEYWFFAATGMAANNHFVLTNSSNGATVRVFTDSGLSIRFDAGILPSGTHTLPAYNRWYHIALTRTGGTSYKLWVDGVEVLSATGTGSDLGTHNVTTCTLAIGAGTATDSSSRAKYNHFRVTKACRYTAAFAPPTAAFPVPSDLTPAPPEGRDYWHGATGLLLLFNGANGSTTFTDQSASAHTVTVSGASLNTSVLRLGSASGNFTAASSYATVPHVANNNLESGDWTIELSVNMAAGSGNRVFLNKGSGTGNYQFQVWFDSASGKIGARGLSSGGSAAFALLASGTASTGVWYDVMVRRIGYVVELFINGVLQSSASHIGSLFTTTATVSVGAFNNGSTNANAHIDCVRITKGLGRHPGPLTDEFKVNT